MQLGELRQSASNMSNEELMQEINTIRAHRRLGASNSATVKTDSRKKKAGVSSLDAMRALLQSLELEDMLKDDEEEPADD